MPQAGGAVGIGVGGLAPVVDQAPDVACGVGEVVVGLPPVVMEFNVPAGSLMNPVSEPSFVRPELWVPACTRSRFVPRTVMPDIGCSRSRSRWCGRSWPYALPRSRCRSCRRASQLARVVVGPGGRGGAGGGATVLGGEVAGLVPAVQPGRGAGADGVGSSPRETPVPAGPGPGRSPTASTTSMKRTQRYQPYGRRAPAG